MTKRQFIQHFQAPSTWRGVVMILSACGIALRPDVAEAITAAGMALVGLLGVLTGPDPLPPAPGGAE
jgi:hypothetical protein